MKKLSVIIIDDHQLFREGFKLLLSNIAGVGEIKEASNGKEFLGMLADTDLPDIVFLDINMPVLNGIEASREAISRYPDLKIIALSMYSDEDYYTQMIEAGAKGFILKNSGIKDVEAALEQVAEGKNFFSQEIMESLLRSINRKPRKLKRTALSEREEEVLYLICKGMSNQEIGNQLFISKRTVDKHRENLLSKTGSNNTAGLVMFAIRSGIVEL